MSDRFVIVVGTVMLFVSSVSADEHWVAVWGSGMELPFFEPPHVLQNVTVRQVVQVSRGGSTARVRFSNATGTTSLQIDAASVGLRSEGASIVAGSIRPLRFDGAASILIPPGTVAVSDPVALQIADRAQLAINVFVAGAASNTSERTQAHQTSYISAPGDYTATTTFTTASAISSWYWLSAIEVDRPDLQTLVTFGDSITEGYGSTDDANTRWPDILAKRLLACGDAISVINTAIGGNRVLTDDIGPNAQRRLDGDMLLQAGAKYAIVLEGINDIGFSQNDPASVPPNLILTNVSAEQIIAGYQQIIRRAHAAGITIYGGTLVPFVGAVYQDAAAELKRQAVNAWIRSGRGFDGVIDFDVTTRDPAAPAQLLAAFDSGDHLHPNDAGYAAMGKAIDLALFRSGVKSGCQ
jgi:lysophospholipase L1-like esterase